MSKLKAFALISVLTLGSAVARADSFSGFFSANGTDQFTSSTITFGSASVQGTIGGDFATYLVDGTPINFIGGALPYTQGSNNVAPGGGVQLFTVGGGGELFAFTMTNYSAAYITDGSSGCLAGSTCLNATGIGFFTATGPLTGTSNQATFTFTSQYAPGATSATLTTFSASASAPAPTPEPASLALVGSGLLAVVGAARRRFNA